MTRKSMGILTFGLALVVFLAGCVAPVPGPAPAAPVVAGEAAATAGPAGEPIRIAIILPSSISEQLAALSAAVLAGFLSALVTIITTGMTSLVIVAFFLLEIRALPEHHPHGRDRGSAHAYQLPAVGQTAVTYFSIRARLNLITGAGVTLICCSWAWITLLVGRGCVLLEFVPYIGLVLAMIPPLCWPWPESGWVQALIVVIGVTLINLLIENVLEPGYTGKRLSLSPTIVFLSGLLLELAAWPGRRAAIHADHGLAVACVQELGKHAVAGEDHRQRGCAAGRGIAATMIKVKRERRQCHAR